MDAALIATIVVIAVLAVALIVVSVLLGLAKSTPASSSISPIPLQCPYYRIVALVINDQNQNAYLVGDPIAKTVAASLTPVDPGSLWYVPNQDGISSPNGPFALGRYDIKNGAFSYLVGTPSGELAWEPNPDANWELRTLRPNQTCCFLVWNRTGMHIATYPDLTVKLQNDTGPSGDRIVFQTCTFT